MLWKRLHLPVGRKLDHEKLVRASQEKGTVASERGCHAVLLKGESRLGLRTVSYFVTCLWSA